VKVLVLNCGSSTLKFQLVETDAASERAATDRSLARGVVDGIGANAVLKLDVSARGEKPVREGVDAKDVRAAVERSLALVCRGDLGLASEPGEIEAVGHRVVHGGERFRESVLIDDGVVEGIEACFDMAPLHNPANLRGYRAAREILPGVPHVAVFDTSFHQRMPREAFFYGLPYVLYERYGIRRYGFHGTSHRYVSRRLAQILGRPADDPSLRLVTLHLGNGCSGAAIRGGTSIDTSMGFSPLEGLLMGTRSGDVDPAALLHVVTREELSPAEANALLNKHSGLLGLSGRSGDMRHLLEAEAEGDDRARLAIEVFTYRVKKCVAAYFGVLGGIDGLAFAGGIGENAPSIRARSLEGLEALGIRLDEERNDAARGAEREISPEGARCRVFAIPTNEELLIARDTCRIVSGRKPD